MYTRRSDWSLANRLRARNYTLEQVGYLLGGVSKQGVFNMLQGAIYIHHDEDLGHKVPINKLDSYSCGVDGTERMLVSGIINIKGVLGEQ